MNRTERITGCLLAGAAGDALGAPVEFLPLRAIRERYGPGEASPEWRRRYPPE
jgi:ADP-ribosylglycohydrolase